MPAVDAYSHGVPRSGRIGGRRLRSDPGTRLPLAPRVPFLRAPASAAGAVAVAEALRNGHLKARGPATARCERLLQDQLSAPTVLMTQSCTAALELSALLLGVVAGDEIIMPSFGFASAANAFVLRGATPVFVDVLPGTLNIDPAEVRAALTARTRAVVVVHYA
ncbi:MAG: rffA, partial [Frankiales bacterium]|nr:rffA [Frankiales bacterium]